jgi:hypothetical protein
MGGGAGSKGRPTVGTWLVVRYDPADQGARPIPAGDVFWESPDIWLTGGDAFGNPIGGSPATLFAQVWNLGSLAANPVGVDFSFIAPSLGIPASAPELIGTGWGTVPALSAAVIECPVAWIPPITKGDLHSCLIVTCSAPLQNDVPTVPGSAVADRHTGQHNLTVIEATAGQQFRFEVVMANLGPLPTAVQLVAAAAWHRSESFGRDGFVSAPSLLSAIEGAAGPANADTKQMWARRAVTLSERGPSADLQFLSSEDTRQAVVVAGFEEVGSARSNPIVGPPGRQGSADMFTSLNPPRQLAPEQRAVAAVTVNVPTEAVYPWFIAHLAQSSGGALTGGYSVAFHLTG